MAFILGYTCITECFGVESYLHAKCCPHEGTLHLLPLYAQGWEGCILPITLVVIDEMLHDRCWYHVPNVLSIFVLQQSEHCRQMVPCVARYPVDKTLYILLYTVVDSSCCTKPCQQDEPTTQNLCKIDKAACSGWQLSRRALSSLADTSMVL